jgi:ribonuclease VapC
VNILLDNPMTQFSFGWILSLNWLCQKWGQVQISAASFVELSIVVEAQIGPDASRQCDIFFRRAGILIEPVTVEQAHLARQAFLDFGKGRHAAGLNFGDCFSYALAKITGAPLLFKGEDFKRTDIPSAL